MIKSRYFCRSFLIVFSVLILSFSVFADSSRSPADLVSFPVSDLPFDTSSPWCVRFARWVSETCFDVPVDLLSPSDSCTWSIRWYSGKDQFHYSNPQIGDWVFYDWEIDGVPDHVGVIYSINYQTNSIEVIEGNVNNGIFARIVALDDRRLCGFASPGSSSSGSRSPHSVVQALAPNENVDVVSPVTPNQSNGFKAVLLGLIGDYNTVVTEYRYTNSNGYTSIITDVQPDYVWIAGCALIALVILCLFKLIGGMIKRG